MKIAISLLLAAFISTIHAEDTLKVKDLFIGMKLSEALDIVNTKFKESITGTYQIRKAKDGFFICNKEAGSLGEFVEASRESIPEEATILIEADNDQSVNYIKIDQLLSNAIFNTTDLNPEQFAQKFIDSYDVPDLKAFVETKSVASQSPGNANLEFRNKTDWGGWEYVSSSGYRLRIYKDKSVVITAIPKEKERSFD